MLLRRWYSKASSGTSVTCACVSVCNGMPASVHWHACHCAFLHIISCTHNNDHRAMLLVSTRRTATLHMVFSSCREACDGFAAITMWHPCCDVHEITIVLLSIRFLSKPMIAATKHPHVNKKKRKKRSHSVQHINIRSSSQHQHTQHQNARSINNNAVLMGTPSHNCRCPCQSSTKPGHGDHIPRLDVALTHCLIQRKRNGCCTRVAILAKIAHHTF